MAGQRSWQTPKALLGAARNLSLRWRILLPFIALSLVIWLVAADHLGRSFANTILAQGQTETDHAATATVRHLELRLKYLEWMVAIVATEGELVAGDRSVGEALDELGPGMMTAFASGQFESAAFRADLVRIVRVDGRPLLTLRRNLLETGTLQDQALVSAGLDGEEASGIVTVAGARAAYVAGVSPITLGKSGTLAIVLGSSLDEQMLTEIGVPTNQDVFVIGPNGIVTRTGPTSRNPEWTRILSGPRQGSISLDDTDYLVSSMPVTAPLTPGLRVVTALPTAPLIAKGQAARTQALYIVGIGLAVFVAVGLWLSATLTRPLRAVTRAAHALAGGDLTARTPVASQDEIGTLASAFNTMGDELVRREKSLDEAIRDLKHLSETDALTGLLNHRALNERLGQELVRAQRHGLTLGLIVIDIDGFKLVNDTYGHPVGDEIIRMVSRVITGNVRASDIAGRNGGDEFVAIFTEIGPAETAAAARKLRDAMRKAPMTTPDGLRVPIRLSMGVACYPANGKQMDELLAFADANLYKSKRRGGDVITCGDEENLIEEVTAGGFTMLDSMVTAVDNKDRYTRRHSDEVTRAALEIAEEVGMSEDSKRVLRMAGLLHDVGKIGVPDPILRKPGHLTADEYEIVKQHATLGVGIIQGLPHNDDVRSAVGSHHERWDGLGYPRGASGRDIPVLGRVLAIADAYSAMTSDRPYRQALSHEEAIEELRAGAGKQFDPQLVAVALRIHESLAPVDTLAGSAPDDA